EIGDRGAVEYPARGPAVPRRLQHPGTRRIGDDEGVVVGAEEGGLAGAALAIFLDQRPDDAHRLAGGAGALQAEAHQVHADQRDLLVRLAREDRLVADRDAPLVDAHLVAPEPVRARADQLPGL